MFLYFKFEITQNISYPSYSLNVCQTAILGRQMFFPFGKRICKTEKSDSSTMRIRPLHPKVIKCVLLFNSCIIATNKVFLFPHGKVTSLQFLPSFLVLVKGQFTLDFTMCVPPPPSLVHISGRCMSLLYALAKRN